MRIARIPTGEVVLDLGGEAPGRGAYVCSKMECLDAALQRGRLAAALRVRDGNDERLRERFEELVR